MPTLDTMPRTCPLSPNIAVPLLDCPVAISNLATGAHKETDYLAIDPPGKVPAVRLDDGDVPIEAAAILASLGATCDNDADERHTRLGRHEAEDMEPIG